MRVYPKEPHPKGSESHFPVGAKAVLEELSRLDVNPESLDLQRISDLIEALFQEIESEDIGELIAYAVSQGLLTQAQGNKVIEVAMWCGQSNGQQLGETIERWLEEGANSIKIELALAQSTFPFSTQAKMAEVLAAIIKRYPQFAPAMNGLIVRRKAQGV